MNGLTSDFAGFVRNYNKHNMGKTIGELHALLIEYEKGLPKKAATPQVMVIQGGRIQKANKKSQNAKGKGKGKGQGSDKSYIPKPKNPKLTAKEHPTKDDACHHCKEVGHCKRNCHAYLAELIKKKKQVSTVSSSNIFVIELFSFPTKSWVYDTSCGNHICNTKHGLRGVRKLKQVEAIGSFGLVLPNGLVICLEFRQLSYFITFTDGYSRYGYVYLLKHKHEVFDTFKVFKYEVENQLEKTLKALRSNRGDEYICQEFTDYLKAYGIVQQLTHPYTSLLTGVSERRNHTLLDMVQSMMNLATLPLSFWDYALETATRILNMVPTKKVDKTSYELWYGKVSNLSYLKVWGCEALVKRDTPDKLHQRFVKCIFIGYLKEMMGYYFYFPPENKIVVVRLKVLNHLMRKKLISVDPEFDKWLDAMNAEMQSIKDNQVWCLVDLPPNCKTVGSKWLFKKKTDMDGILYTYKACLVAKGYTKLYRVDYEETFSLVVDIRAIRILIAIAAFYDYKIWKIYTYLGKCFAMIDLREAGFILGIKIYRDRSKRLIRLSQSAYMDKILKGLRWIIPSVVISPCKKDLTYIKHKVLQHPKRLPVKLDLDDWNYESWEYFFEQLCSSYEVTKFLHDDSNAIGTSTVTPLTPEEVKVEMRLKSKELTLPMDSLLPWSLRLNQYVHDSSAKPVDISSSKQLGPSYYLAQPISSMMPPPSFNTRLVYHTQPAHTICSPSGFHYQQVQQAVPSLPTKQQVQPALQATSPMIAAQQSLSGPPGSIVTTKKSTLLPQAFTTRIIHDPTTGAWNRDTGASSYLNNSINSLSTVFNSCLYLSISVGDGHSIPVTNKGPSILPTISRPLHLNNVLITLHIVKKVIYVRQFVSDNNCTIEFNSFGFSVKEFLTCRMLLRCDSTRDLNSVTAPSLIMHAFLVSQHTWHQRLGHPGSDVLHSLVSNNVISCNKEKPPVLCHACQLGKHARLLFVSFSTIVASCFDIILSDVWTSPILSLSGYEYYVLFLDHYSQFVWVYPLLHKSDVLSKFVLFRNYVRTQFKSEMRSFQCDHGGEFDNRTLHKLLSTMASSFAFHAPIHPNKMIPHRLLVLKKRFSPNGFGFYPRLLTPYISLRDKDLQKSKDLQVVSEPVYGLIINVVSSKLMLFGLTIDVVHLMLLVGAVLNTKSGLGGMKVPVIRGGTT
nr:ribonuclease H-like domain-containing protein [Tanacetum cinerariifolium]